jgi:hypothetical protein
MKQKRYLFLRWGPLWVALILLCPRQSQAQAVDDFLQDIRDRISDKEFMKVNGSLQANLRWNQISGASARIQPFSGQLTSALLVDILSIKGGFSAAFSDGNLNYNLPAYAFYGFSPSYKWIQLHLGDRSMELSPYTLSGHNFKGVGLELRPGKFHFAAFSGRLRAARQADAGAIQNIDPIYKRWGKGLKLGFDDGDNQLGLVLFHAKDDATSLSVSDSTGLRPQENLVLEMQGKKIIGKRFDIGFQLGRSALTRDMIAPELDNVGAGLNGSVLGLFKPNSSSAYGNAWNFELGFNPSFARFSISAERMDAGFQSLGRLAFLNDTENIQLNGNTSLFKNKVSLAGSLGLQRNGLSDKKTTTGNRVIGSLNLGMSVTERLTLSASLSNINYTMRQRVSTVPVLVVDSIVIVQNNASLQLSSNLLLGAEKQSALLFSIAFQRAATESGSSSENTQLNDFYSGIAAYSWTEPDQAWSVTLSCVTSYTNISVISSTIISPSLNVQKVVLEDRLTVDGGAAHSFVFSSVGSRTSVWETRIGGQYKLADKHNFRTQFSYVNNRTMTDPIINAQVFKDLNAHLTYQFNF